MTTEKSDPLNDLIEHCYDAATEDEGLWNSIVPRIATSMGAAAGALHVVDVAAGTSEMLGRLGYTDTMIANYVANWVPKDLWIQKCLPKLNEVVSTDQLIADQAFGNSEIYNEFFRHNLDLFWSAGAMFRLDDDRIASIALQRRRDQGVYENADLQLLRPLMPHLRRALNLRMKLNRLGASMALGFDALDHLDTGIAIVDRHGRIRFANGALQAIADGADGLRFSKIGGRIEAISPGDNARLNRMIGTATSELFAGEGGGSMQIARPNDSSAWLALVAPFHPGARRARPGEARLALLLVEDRAARLPKLGQQLRALFGLTAAEADLAVALVDGERLEDICAKRNVGLATGRTQLRAIFAKTGTDRQSSFIRLAMTLPRTR